MVQNRRQFGLKGIHNVDWVRSVDDRKKMSGGAFFLGKRLVSWTSKKQKLYLSVHNRRIIYGSSS